jgi:hypothetical protein
MRRRSRRLRQAGVDRQNDWRRLQLMAAAVAPRSSSGKQIERVVAGIDCGIRARIDTCVDRFVSRVPRLTGEATEAWEATEAREAAEAWEAREARAAFATLATRAADTGRTGRSAAAASSTTARAGSTARSTATAAAGCTSARAAAASFAATGTCDRARVVITHAGVVARVRSVGARATAPSTAAATA